MANPLDWPISAVPAALQSLEMIGQANETSFDIDMRPSLTPVGLLWGCELHDIELGTMVCRCEGPEPNRLLAVTVQTFRATLSEQGYALPDRWLPLDLPLEDVVTIPWRSQLRLETQPGGDIAIVAPQGAPLAVFSAEQDLNLELGQLLLGLLQSLTSRQI